jgi:hypothetical protein
MKDTQEQHKLNRRSKMGRLFKPTEPVSTDKHGLFGSEKDVLDKMFDQEKKLPIKFDKLTNLQKKVLRKMKYEKHWFLKNTH